jgi:AraC-like DNA-binding protein
MTYTRYVPSPPLDAYITCLYCPNGPIAYPCEKILPMPSLDLKVNFGGVFQVYDAKHTEPIATCAESWCVGLWNTYHIVNWPTNLQYLGVVFKPGGAYPFLQFPLSELHNQVIPLDAIWGSFAAEIREQLYAAPTMQARFALFEQFLGARLREGPPELKAVQYALGQIAKQHGTVSIRNLSDQIGMSQKHLIAQFKRMVGGTPKELARLCRFAHILYRIDPTQPVDWTWMAHQFLYYDQSHFNRDFEAFTGHSPTDYLQLRRQVQARNPEHIRYRRLLPAG